MQPKVDKNDSTIATYISEKATQRREESDSSNKGIQNDYAHKDGIIKISNEHKNIHHGGKCCIDNNADQYDGNGGFGELADMLW